MTYVIIFLVLFVVFVFFVLFTIRKKWAIRKVRKLSECEKLEEVNKVLYPFGFAFDLNQDIVISRNDAWQREVGFCNLYDLKAPFFNIVTDAEPIYFVYREKEYRLEFWKGQYGITTGAEIGLYVREKNSKDIKGFYRSVSDFERLQMGFMLYDNCFLFSRSDCSWWLTGFDVGKFSHPRDLTLKICIAFPNQEMQIAFVEGLLKAGYEQNKIKICEGAVCFSFCCSHHYMNHKHKLIKCFAQVCNCINVALFNFCTRYFTTTLDKLVYIRYMFPCLYRFIIKCSIPKRKHKHFLKNKQRRKKNQNVNG